MNSPVPRFLNPRTEGREKKKGEGGGRKEKKKGKATGPNISGEELESKGGERMITPHYLSAACFQDEKGRESNI